VSFYVRLQVNEHDAGLLRPFEGIDVEVEIRPTAKHRASDRVTVLEAKPR
jgi:hypothetical protein